MLAAAIALRSSVHLFPLNTMQGSFWSTPQLIDEIFTAYQQQSQDKMLPYGAIRFKILVFFKVKWCT